MKRMWKSLTTQMTPNSFDGAVAQGVCFAGGVAILGVGFRKLASLPLSQGEMFLGMLGVLAVGLLMICLGLLLRLLHLAALSREPRKES